MPRLRAANRKPEVAMPKRPTCPYCKKPAKLVDSSIIYGRSFGWLWLCNCKVGNSYVGCHAGTKRPVGTLADTQTRAMRKRANAAFDPIWRTGRMTRREAYMWLAHELGLSAEQAHIAMSDAAQCIQIIDVCKRRNEEGA